MSSKSSWAKQTFATQSVRRAWNSLHWSPKIYFCCRKTVLLSQTAGCWSMINVSYINNTHTGLDRLFNDGQLRNIFLKCWLNKWVNLETRASEAEAVGSGCFCWKRKRKRLSKTAYTSDRLRCSLRYESNFFIRKLSRTELIAFSSLDIIQRPTSTLQ